jgi:uncharacterized protein YkwD
MSRIQILFLLLLSCPILSAQNYIDEKVWNRWDSVTIAKANTAVKADYMTSEERLVILITNLARTNGELFCETFLYTYLEGQEQDKYTRSLYRDLKKVNGLPMLNPEKDLFDVAKGHAEKSGKSGHVGHQGFEARFKPLMKKYNTVAENCAYGYDTATDIVLQLLIDRDIPELGHRLNILNPQLNSVGVSIQPHKTYNYNCVMDFGKK